MVLDGVLQLLQEGQICGLPRAQTLLVLGVWHRVMDVSREGLESTGNLGAPCRRQRHGKRGRSKGLPRDSFQMQPAPHLTLHAEPCPVPAQPQTLALRGLAWRERGRSDVLPPGPHTRLWRNRRLTKMEMMPLNFSSTRSQMILLLKYWTGSH